MRRNVAVMLVVLLFSIMASAKDPKKLPTKEYDLGSGTVTGDTLRGPRRVIAKNLNVLRYNYQFNSTVSFSQPVDLFSKLTGVAAPSSTPAPASTGGAGAPEAPGSLALSANCQDSSAQTPLAQHLCQLSTVQNTIKQRFDIVNVLAGRVATNFTTLTALITVANCDVGVVKGAGAALNNLLLASTGDPGQTVAGITTQLQNGGGMPCGAGANPGTDSTFIRGTKAEWPDFAAIANLTTGTADLQRQLDQQAATFPAFMADQTAAIAAFQRSLQEDLKPLSTKKNPTDDDKTNIQDINKSLVILKNAASQLQLTADTLNSATAQNAKIASALPDLQTNGQKYNDFVAARDLLRTWKTRMETLQANWNAFQNDEKNQPDPFSRSAVGDCGFAFSRTKTTALSLIASDQMPGATTPNPITVLSVSVECSSPFTISAGVEFTTLKEREFSIQPVANPPGSVTTTNEFVATTQSSFHPLPLGMIHARLWEPKEWFSLHASFGIAGNIRSQNSGGSDPEFLIGPSIALFRTMFLTPGLHLGREVSLGANFQENEPVPANITTPPLQKSYKSAFGFAITFTKP